MFKLIIDNRELSLKEHFINNENVVIERCDVGDLILKKEDEIIMVIERKSICDLFASIKDGRHREQKCRLTNNFDKSKIYYLIEGTLQDLNDYQKDNFQIVYGSIINTLVRDNIKIIRTFDFNDTLKFVTLILNKTIKTPQIFINNNSDTCKNDYLSSVKLSKKANITPVNCFILQLSLIPGVSKNIAKYIANEYKSISGLLEAYKNIVSDEKKNMLKDIEMSINNDKKRKIGKVISERIYTYLHNI